MEQELSLWQRFLAWWNAPRDAAGRERERYIAHLERENAELKDWLKSLNGSLVAGLGMPIIPTSQPAERKPIQPVARHSIPSLRRNAYEAKHARQSSTSEDGARGN